METNHLFGPTWPKHHLSFVWGLKNRPQASGTAARWTIIRNFSSFLPSNLEPLTKERIT